MKTHVTAYGDALADPNSETWDYLDYYDTIICSPGKLWHIENKRPKLTTKCIIYCNFFTRHEEVSDPRFDILPTPHEVDSNRPIYSKTQGGESFIYYQSWRWAMVFTSRIIDWLYRHPFKVGGIFLDEWTISHSWWQISAANYAASQGEATERRAMMELVEKTLSVAVKKMTTLGLLVSNGERIILPPSDLKIYHESCGASWQPWERVLDRSESGDFWQINSSKKQDRFFATFFAEKSGVSVGMQPDEGVLSYHNIEDPRKWGTIAAGKQPKQGIDG